MDEQERIERRAHVRLIITEVLMFLSVILLVGFLTLIVMGYSFNLRELGGSGEVVERSGLVQISSMPTGATIYIDGEAPLLLSTNASRTMLAGEHEISLARDGFGGWSKKIVVTKGMMYRLNYPRLFKEEREAEEVMRFYAPTDVSDRVDKVVEDVGIKTYAGKIRFVSVSPNNERMIVLLDKDLYLMNINDNMPELKVLAVPSKDGSSVVKITTIESAEWSGNSERLLARINDEWATLNVRDPKETVWLDGIIGTDEISDIKIESEIGDRLLVLYKTGKLVELNVREMELSDTLLEDVEKFDNDADRVVFLTKRKTDFIADKLAEELIASEDKWQVRAYRVGEAESFVLKQFDLEASEELGSVKLATMRYFQESYVGIARDNNFEVYSKTGWVAGDNEMEKVFTEEASFTISRLKKRGKGMVFELSGDDGNTEVFDIEAMATTSVDVKDTGWVDEYLRFRLSDGKLSVLDYDGLNERTLVESSVIAGRVVAISGNGRWLYYFSCKEMDDNDIREILIREKIN